MNSNGGVPRLERKTVEKNRRMLMKDLCSKLSSLIPKDNNSSKGAMTQQDHLDRAMAYIEHLKERIQRLKHRKESGSSADRTTGEGMMAGFSLPVIEVMDLNSSLLVVLVSGLKKPFMLHEVIGVLEEEGAEAINMSFSVVGGKIFHTFYSRAVCPRIGLDASKVSERLKKMVHWGSLGPTPEN